MIDPLDGTTDKDLITTALRGYLARVKELRVAISTDPAAAAIRLKLREWQAARLARTYADLLLSDRYRPAAAFFLSDIYGPKDLGARNDEVEHILPVIVSFLPAGGVRTVALTIGMDALSEELDAAMCIELQRCGEIDAIDEARYATAYRACDNRPAREQQIALLGEVGRTLEELARRPLLGTAIHMMRKPAQMAGVPGLHEFLQRGFDAFKHMGEAAEFIELIRSRETRILDQLLAGSSQPFVLE